MNHDIDKPPDAQDHGTGEVSSTVTVRELRPEDLDDLRTVLETAVINPITREVIQDEVEEILKSLTAALTTESNATYFVAETSDGRVAGMMGLTTPGEIMRSFATTAQPIELINAYVSRDQRGVGVGSHLVHHLESVAKTQGYTETIVNSGPRYRFSGWPFWQRMYGDPIATAEKYYDGEWDAMVWHKELTD